MPRLLAAAHRHQCCRSCLRSNLCFFAQMRCPGFGQRLAKNSLTGSRFRGCFAILWNVLAQVSPLAQALHVGNGAMLGSLMHGHGGVCGALCGPVAGEVPGHPCAT